MFEFLQHYLHHYITWKCILMSSVECFFGTTRILSILPCQKPFFWMMWMVSDPGTGVGWNLTELSQMMSDTSVREVKRMVFEVSWSFSRNTLPETNSSHLKICLPKRKLVFQPSIFRCNVSFREGIRENVWKCQKWMTECGSKLGARSATCLTPEFLVNTLQISSRPFTAGCE